MYRPNLNYEVVQVTNEAEKLARAVEHVVASSGAGLVYAATVKAAEALHVALRSAGVEVGLYHGRLGPAARSEAQEAFMAGRTRVMVATNAFGLGIDKPDIRFVLHYQMPAGLDAYYQETGRVGRDGMAARCTLLFLHSDRAVQQFFLAGRYPSKDDLSAIYAALARQRDDDQAWTIDLLQAALDRPKTKIAVALQLLRHQKVARRLRDGRLSLTRAGLDENALDKLLAGYRAKRDGDRAMLERMVAYGQTGRCRWRVLLENFAEEPSFESCQHCDNCARIAALMAESAARLADPVAETPPQAGPDVFEAGALVRVPRYGEGVVERADGEGVTVVFAEGSRRVFLAAFVRRATRSAIARAA
jgi:ATP-dependent DNA helicase RecQ